MKQSKYEKRELRDKGMMSQSRYPFYKQCCCFRVCRLVIKRDLRDNILIRKVMSGELLSFYRNLLSHFLSSECLLGGLRRWPVDSQLLIRGQGSTITVFFFLRAVRRRKVAKKVFTHYLIKKIVITVVLLLLVMNSRILYIIKKTLNIVEHKSQL